MTQRSSTMRGRKLLLLGLVGLLAWGLCWPAATQAGPIKRLRADYESVEISTILHNAANGGLGGISLYNQTVTVPTGMNTLRVTISGTGDQQGPVSQNVDNAALWMSCNVNGVPCNPGKTAATGKTGWTAMQHPEADLQDNSFHYTWCAAVQPGTRTVEIRMASSNGGTVAVEKLNYFIDASNLNATDGSCAALGGANGTLGVTGGATSVSGGTVGIQGP